MSEMTREVPKKPTEMAAFWPADGRKEHTNKDGLWLKYRDITIGPFPNRTEASWYDGQVQDVIMGWNRKELFAGRIFPFGDAWYVERWETNDGPFTSLGVAVEHRQKLYDEYAKVSEELWQKVHGKAKKTTDDLMDVSYDLSKFLAEHSDTLKKLAEASEKATDDG